MWNDQISEHYRWAKIKTQQDEILFQLFKAEDEEESGLYLLKLHFENRTDMECFSPSEERAIKKLLKKLIRDTMRHSGLLHDAAEELQQQWGIGHAS